MALRLRATDSPLLKTKFREDIVAGALVTLDSIDSFRAVKDYPASIITNELLTVVKQLHEREELEPFFRSILTDVGDTPHGPSEVVDILSIAVCTNSYSDLGTDSRNCSIQH